MELSVLYNTLSFHIFCLYMSSIYINWWFADQQMVTKLRTVDTCKTCVTVLPFCWSSDLRLACIVMQIEISAHSLQLCVNRANKNNRKGLAPDVNFRHLSLHFLNAIEDVVYLLLYLLRHRFPYMIECRIKLT